MRRRILVAIVGVATVAVLLFAVPLGFAVARLYREEELLRLQRRATAAARGVTRAALQPGDRVEIPRPEDETDVAVYTSDGRRVAGEGPARGDYVVAQALRNHTVDDVGATTIATAVPITDNEQVLAAVRAAEPRSVLDDRVHRAWLIMAAFGAGAIGAAAVLAWFQARRLARPVEALRRSVSRLGDGDFTVRAEPTGVPEIDDAGRALDVAAERLGTLVDRERAFSADASHQLRTPITTLRLGIETALADARADPREALEEALQDTDRLADTVQELLALARDTPAQRDPWSLGGLLDEVEDRWHGPLAREGRPLRVHKPTHAISITCPRAAAMHVLDVLIDNADRHGSGAVSLSVREVSGGVTLHVEDEGPGIEGDLERIFTRRASEAQGSGIGLSMARRLAESAGGRLVVRQARPHAVFELFLPVTPSA